MIQGKPEHFDDYTKPWPAEDYAAWRATWNSEEKLLAHTPPGYWYDLVIISRVKRLLQQEMPADLRLRFLEIMNSQVQGHLSLEAMQTVTPACDTAMKMLDEMEPLCAFDKCSLMRKWNVMAAFCNLNPSLISAMKLFRSPESAAA